MPDMTSTDHFGGHAPSLEGPANAAFSITPDDDTDLPSVTRAVYVGGGGTLTVQMAWGGEASFQYLESGSLLPIRIVRVKESSTATAIVGLY